MTYAQNTSVSTDKSRAEIEKTLQRYGADQFMYGWDDTKALIMFRMNGRQIRFVLPMPSKSERQFTHTKARGQRRSDQKALEAWEQGCRQRWRALALVIKAKLEAIESGISIFENEFMANVVLPDGSTVSDFMLPQIERAYETGDMPHLLPDMS